RRSGRSAARRDHRRGAGKGGGGGGVKAGMKKLQAPSSKLHRNSKFQIPKALRRPQWKLLVPFTDLIQSGRGLAALQHAVARAKRIVTPPGFGVRPVLCRFSFL